MVSKYQKPIVSFWIVMLVTILDQGMHASNFVTGLGILDKSNFRPKPTGTIKTIEVPEDGDLIDCVDIYKQPSLNNPLIKDKTIKMKPSSGLFPTFNKTKRPLAKIIQSWHKYGKCPKGTVPIRRSRSYNDTIHHRYPNNDDHEYVTISSYNIYHGASAIFNVWNPRVTGSRELSLSQMWISSGINSPNLANLNTLEAGWMVNPSRYGDLQTRFFTFWTSDNYNTTRCYDYDCNGFRQTNHEYTLGMPLAISEIDGQQFEIIIFISKDEDGKWWLRFQNIELGYFPSDIFTSLNSGADELQFGGEIVNLREGNRHTETQMGSGLWPSEGRGRASYIRNIIAMDRNNVWGNPKINKIGVTHPRCYGFRVGRDMIIWGTHFYFGGPGYGPLCE